MPTLTLKSLLLFCALALAQHALARPVTVPVKLNYQFVENVVRGQLFTGEGNSADMYADEWRCNVLTLSNPGIAGTSDGQLLLEAGLTAQGGTPLGGSCIPLFTWSGVIKTQQKPVLSADGMGLAFQITSLDIEPADPAQPMPPIMQQWVTAFVNPVLESLSFDLKPVLGATQGLLQEAIPGADKDIQTLVNSLAFVGIGGDSENLTVTLQLELPEAWDLAAASSESFSESELASWDTAWQSWDAFATWLIKSLATQSAVRNPELIQALADSLLEARYDLRQALAENDQTRDPVRDLFVKTWDRLTPLLQQELANSAELQGAQFLGFMSAVDALMAVDEVADQFSVKFDSGTLRALARLINPAVTDAELDYSTEVDPELRKLLGLDPDFEATLDGTDAADKLWSAPLAFLIPPAEAAQLDPALVKKLNRWVPNRSDVDSYLTAMQLLLDAIATRGLEKGKVPQRFFPVYEHLLLATAWQESCWRQNENRNGQVTPLKSSAGSVGLMQVNQHVWRGVYNIKSLVDDISYNAKAGNEILIHYLADYAIKRKEHELGGGADALARSAYAMYNGGPGHISRYRKNTTSKSLKQIDAAFLKKYRAIRTRGASAVKSCYGS